MREQLSWKTINVSENHQAFQKNPVVHKNIYE